MRKLLFSAVAFALLGLNAASVGAKLADSDFRNEKNGIEAEYKGAQERCKALAGNARDICRAQAKGKRDVGIADLRARDGNTSKVRQEAREARAKADYAVAREKCDDLAGNLKDVCVKEAKAARTGAMADAKLGRKAADARADSDKTVSKALDKEDRRIADAQKDAAEDRREADYGVAREKCATFAGDAKTRCLDEARARYGKR